MFRWANDRLGSSSSLYRARGKNKYYLFKMVLYSNINTFNSIFMQKTRLTTEQIRKLYQKYLYFFNFSNTGLLNVS